MRLLYTVLFYLALPLILLRLLWRSVKAPAYRQRWLERFGFLSKTIRHIMDEHRNPVIWFHTVSMGETIAAKPLVLSLLEQYPNYCLLITTMTPTGSMQVKAQYTDAINNKKIVHTYIPYDLPDCLSRFLSKTKPQLALFMETEVWPNALAACEKRHIPSVLINARLSERSFSGYQKFAWLTGATFSRLSSVIAQGENDAHRIQKLGASDVIVAGNLKSEVNISDDLVYKANRLKDDWSQSGRRKIIIAASTHRGEDEIILSAYDSLLTCHPETLLILVPRHPERFDDMYALCCDKNFKVQRRSHGEQCVVTSETQLVLGDTMGEMMLFYGVSDIAIVCGSFVESGGHNMLEAAVWGVPILSGPSVFNFAKITQELMATNGLVLVNDEDELSHQLGSLLNNENEMNVIGSNAKLYVEKSRGALDKTQRHIARYL